MAVLMTPPYLQFFDDDGAPLAGGKVYTYTATGTFSTLKATYTTAAGDVAHPNPVILDASGRPATGNGSIWLSGTYDFVVKDANDVTIETTLSVTAFTALPAESDSYFQSFSGNGATVAFTCSEDLGTDEKAIYVWVDAGAGKGYEIQNPSAYTINGTTLTFSVAPASGTNNIYVSAPSLQVGAASSAAADAAASAAAAATSETNAATSATSAAASAAKLQGTSTTSNSISVASKSFTTQSGKFFDVGNFLLITSDANPANYMHGQVTSYSGTSLTVNVTNIGGSGTYADWTIRLSGTRGVKGDTGSISDLSGVPSGTIANNDRLIFQDVNDSDITKACLASELGVLIPLSTQEASNSTSIDFTSGINSTYKKYIITITNLIPASNANLWLRISKSGVFQAGASDYVYANDSIDTGGTRYTSASAGAAQAVLTTLNALAASTHGLDAYIEFTSPELTTSDKPFLWRVLNARTTTFLTPSYGGGGYVSTGAIDGVRFLMETGNITSGTFKLYGVL